MTPGVTMQHADDALGFRFANHRSSVVLCVPGVHYERLAHFGGQSELRGECSALRVTRSVVVVVVQAAFADRDYELTYEPELRNVARSVESCGVVGMNSSGREDKARVFARYLSGYRRRRER